MIFFNKMKKKGKASGGKTKYKMKIPTKKNLFIIMKIFRKKSLKIKIYQVLQKTAIHRKNHRDTLLTPEPTNFNGVIGGAENWLF